MYQVPGCHGVVASGSEVATAHKQNGRGFAIFTPGIRVDETPTNNHKLVLKPKQALRTEGDWLVVGRPILAAPSGQESLQDLCVRTMSCAAPVPPEARKPSGQKELPFQGGHPISSHCASRRKRKAEKAKVPGNRKADWQMIRVTTILLQGTSPARSSPGCLSPKVVAWKL